LALCANLFLFENNRTSLFLFLSNLIFTMKRKEGVFRKEYSPFTKVFNKITIIQNEREVEGGRKKLPFQAIG